MRWSPFWQLGKDVLLTGTGVAVIMIQAFATHPNGLLLGTGLALTVPSTWDHIKALLPSSGAESSSPSSHARGSSPSSSGQEEHGE